jgi:hypothetical protein
MDAHGSNKYIFHDFGCSGSQHFTHEHVVGSITNYHISIHWQIEFNPTGSEISGPNLSKLYILGPADFLFHV